MFNLLFSGRFAHDHHVIAAGSVRRDEAGEAFEFRNGQAFPRHGHNSIGST
jgi:hypothetical protein